MDAFVIRTPRTVSTEDSGQEKALAFFKKEKESRKIKSQRRLKNLRGVVVLEEIKAFVTQLKSSEVGKWEKVKILKKLLGKQPSTEIIVNTGIGKVVKKLTKSSQDPEIAKAARHVKIRWQNLIERRIDLKTGEKPEVISDLQTRTTREKALTLFSEKYPNLSKKTLEKLEKALFNRFRPVIGDKYRRSVRKLTIHHLKFQHLLEANDIDSVVKQVTKSGK